VNAARKRALISLAAVLLASAVAGAAIAFAISRVGIGPLAFATVAAASFVAAASSGAAAAAGFVFVGVFKTSDAFSDPNSPIPTAALVVALAVAALSGRKGERSAIGWSMALVPATIVLAVSALFIGGGTDAAVSKLGRIVALAFVPSVLAAAIFSTSAQRRLFLRAAAIIGGLIGALLVSRGLTDGLSAVGLTLFSENRIVLGRALAVGCIAALAAFTLTPRRSMRALFIVMAALAGMATFFSASRGAVLGLVVGVAVLFAFSLRTGRERWLLASTAAVVGLALLLTVPDSDLADRYLSVVTPGADVTIVQRSLLAATALGTFVEAPLMGGGLGSFVYAFTPSAPPATYAHNMVLELLAETGLVGSITVLVPLIVVAWMSVRRLRRTHDPELAGFFALFASLTAAAQFSGDLQINRHVFFFSGALWGMVVVPAMFRDRRRARPAVVHGARSFI
jgi:O-antigen ligase